MKRLFLSLRAKLVSLALALVSNVCRALQGLHALTSHARLAASLVLASCPLFAHAGASDGVSTALNDWGKYLLWGAATVVAMVGAAVNMEKIII